MTGPRGPSGANGAHRTRGHGSPSLPGTYLVQVWARNAASGSLYDAWRQAGGSIGNATPSDGHGRQAEPDRCGGGPAGDVDSENVGRHGAIYVSVLGIRRGAVARGRGLVDIQHMGVDAPEPGHLHLPGLGTQCGFVGSPRCLPVVRPLHGRPASCLDRHCADRRLRLPDACGHPDHLDGHGQRRDRAVHLPVPDLERDHLEHRARLEHDADMDVDTCDVGDLFGGGVGSQRRLRLAVRRPAGCRPLYDREPNSLDGDRTRARSELPGPAGHAGDMDGGGRRRDRAVHLQVLHL